MKIYQIDSSARKDGSTSRALAKKLLNKIFLYLIYTHAQYKVYIIIDTNQYKPPQKAYRQMASDEEWVPSGNDEEEDDSEMMTDESIGKAVINVRSINDNIPLFAVTK